MAGGHISHNAFAHFLSWHLPHNQHAVSVFMIVSGFVIAHMIHEKRETYGVYILRRGFRIVPIYFFALALAIATLPLYELAFKTLPGVQPGPQAHFASVHAHFWQHLALHLTLLHGIVPDEILYHANLAFLDPAWSISLEWQFYIIAPVLIALLAWRRPGVTLATFIVLIGITLPFEWGLMGSWVVRSVLPLSLPYFMMGILSHRVVARHGERAPYDAYLGLMALFFLIEPLAAIIWAVFLLLVFVEAGVIPPGSAFAQFVARLFVFNRVISTLGRWSYSTYLLHMPVFCIVIGSYIWLAGFRSFSGVHVALLLAASLPLIVILSWLLYNGIERPFIRFGRQLTTSRSTSQESRELDRTIAA